MAPGRSITESSNELTSDIDVATPLQMVRLLRAADGQLFSGYGGYAGMYDSETLITLARLAYIAGKILSNPRGCVVMSGAGTSGRLAMFTARAFNQKQTDPQAPQQFRYTMAGGSQALIQAQEGAEDDAVQSVRDLEEAAAGFDEVFYIGITCGMSAPYIAGQLEHMLNGRMKGHAVLMGFNPVEMARSTPIEGWNGTFLDLSLIHI